MIDNGLSVATKIGVRTLGTLFIDVFKNYYIGDISLYHVEESMYGTHTYYYKINHVGRITNIGVSINKVGVVEFLSGEYSIQEKLQEMVNIQSSAYDRKKKIDNILK